MGLAYELIVRAEGKVLTDMFASSDISQARAICIMLNRIIDAIKENKL